MLLKADVIRCPLKKGGWLVPYNSNKRHIFIVHVAISDINILNKKLYACGSKQLFF